MSGDKKFYMQFGNGESSLEESDKTLSLKNIKHEAKELIKDEAQEFALDEAMDGLLNGIEITQLGGGMVSFTMPLILANFLTKIFEKAAEQERGGFER